MRSPSRPVLFLRVLEVAFATWLPDVDKAGMLGHLTTMDDATHGRRMGPERSGVLDLPSATVLLRRQLGHPLRVQRRSGSGGRARSMRICAAFGRVMRCRPLAGDSTVAENSKILAMASRPAAISPPTLRPLYPLAMTKGGREEGCCHHVHGTASGSWGARHLLAAWRLWTSSNACARRPGPRGTRSRLSSAQRLHPRPSTPTWRALRAPAAPRSAARLRAVGTDHGQP